MDEQRLRARLAALDTAVRLIGADETVDSVVTLAESLEDWLMRPAPVDVSGVDDPHGRRFHVGTVGRCPAQWRNPSIAGPVHQCAWTSGHRDEMGHLCLCGDRLESAA